MPERLVKKRVRVTSEGRTRTMPGRFRAEVDRDAGTVVLFDGRSNEVARLEGATITDDGARVVKAEAEGQTWRLETSRCSCGG